jgi:PAS domain S-box-containing protein
VLDGTIETFSLEYPCPFGTIPRWFFLQATPLRTSDGGVVVSHLDITDRILAEEAVRDREARLRAILDTAADAILTINEQGIIQSVNPATEQLFGHTSAEMLGQNVKMLMPSPDREQHDSYIKRFLTTGQARVIGSGREVIAQRADGSTFPADLSVSKVSDLKLFTGILRDITRRKQLEREVVEIASLEQRRIGQDLHDTVGQELTALNLLAGDLADVIQTDPLEGAKLVARMARGLRRSRQELRSVLIGLLPVAVETEGLMAALTDLADRTQQEGKAACLFECPEPVLLTDNLTATHIFLIAKEAVHNAVKHGRPRNIRISLESNHRLRLRVQDDGIGLAPQSSAKPGTGLGLRIMQNRAAIIGAQLTVEPIDPHGTLITCVLPRKNDE